MKKINKKIILNKGDITHFSADAMGNAANTKLAGGGGVDGAIHRAAGPELLNELKNNYPSGCKTGDAVITKAYGSLKVKYVIHAVGPYWNNGNYSEDKKLYSAYYRSYELAEKKNCNHILMPAISTGVYRYPLNEASQIAITATKNFLVHSKYLTKIEFIIFGDELLDIFKKHI